MKILIFYTPRSKSTMALEVIAKKFNLTPLVDPLVHSKIRNQNTSEFPSIIDQINSSQNICVKISSTDFLDSRMRRVVDYYKDIDYNSFDKIIFITRNNVLSAALSFTYMDSKNKDTWHRRKGEDQLWGEYNADLDRVHYLLRGYRVYNFVKEYIINSSNTEFYDYEFETVESSMKRDFNMDDSDFDISLINNDLDYMHLVKNLQEVSLVIQNLSDVILTAHDEDLNKFDSNFWMYHVKIQYT